MRNNTECILRKSKAKVMYSKIINRVPEKQINKITAIQMFGLKNRLNLQLFVLPTKIGERYGK